MYTPRSFEMPDDELQGLLRSARVGDYVTHTADGIQATYLPVVYDPDAGERGAFHLHFMRVNPQWQGCDGEALLILHGNSHIIQASYYGDTTSVGTLNYETVHVYGQPIIRDDIDYLWDVVAKVAEANETTWRIEDLEHEAGEKMLRAAVGVELRITRIEAKAKLSQNKRPEVIASLADQLETDGRPDAAALLRERSLPVATARQEVVDAAAARKRGKAEPTTAP